MREMGGIGLKIQGIRVGMWGMQGIREGIWGMGVGMQVIRLEMRENWGKKKDVGMEMRHKHVFVYNYILCKNFFTKQVVSHIWWKICFRKFKVLMLKIVRSIFPKQYLFLQIITPLLVLDYERCAISNTVYLTKLWI